MVLNSRESFSFDNRLIGNIVKEYPDTVKVLKKYFGENCFKQSGFKIKNLEIACILFGVEPYRMLQEIEKIKIDRHGQKTE
jgi:hypothetical protein